MPWYKRLRWRLVSVQLLVVISGIVSMLLLPRWVLSKRSAETIHSILAPYIGSAEAITQAENKLLTYFQQATFSAATLAGLIAILAGVVASLILWRTLVVPLRRIAAASRRVAAGRFDERLPTAHQGGQALHQVITSFNQMAHSLEQIDKKRIELIANVTHELRTPLTGLQGLVEGIEDGIYQADSATMQRMSGEISRLARLVNDIQVLAKVEAGALRLKPIKISLSRVVTDSVMQLQAQAGGKHQTLSVHLPTFNVNLIADKDRVVQILTNIIGNALLYTPPNGDIKVQLLLGDNTAQIVVKDNGIGIPADKLPYIFERFYRVDAARVQNGGGSGVGLSISRNLAWAMGGELSAESDGLGRGSTFTLTLPSLITP